MLGRCRMERLIINHQRRRGVKKKAGFTSDHIIPYSLCMDDSEDNLQFLTKEEHNAKTLKDFKILRLFRKRGWTEKVTNYSIELKRPISFLKSQYVKEYNGE